MKRPRLRALLAPAAVAAAVALSGCNPSDIPTNGRALAPLSERMVATIAEKNMDKGSPILVRIFKEESELEVWKQNRDGQFALLKTYPICRWSGALGPKIKQGDRQAPEGFYTITPAQMNPSSNYYLAFNTGYPNAFDRAWGRTGSELMVHGDCSSAGCYAMTDEQIQEIYALARDSFFGGQKEFQLQAFPFRMTALNMAKHRNNPHFAFWKMLKEGYDDFNATYQEPKVAVCEKRYVFDAAPPENASKPLSFNARGKCPVYRLDPTVADAVLDYRRHEQIKMANYIAENVATVPIHQGVDGGMNPVFATKLASLGDGEKVGNQVYNVYGSAAPGALPHTPNPPVPRSEMQGVLPAGAVSPAATAAAAPAEAAEPTEPVVTASVPMPTPAPLPKEGTAPQQRPAAVAGFFGKLFSGRSAQAAQPTPVVADTSASDDTAPVALRGSNTELAAKPKQAPVRTASAPVVLHPKLAQAAAKPQHKPRAVAHNVPKPAVQQAEKEPAAPAAQMRTAYSAPVPNGNGLMAGAQPVVPTGSFESRWDALR